MNTFNGYTLTARKGAEVEVFHFNTLEAAKDRGLSSEFYGWTVSAGYSVDQMTGFVVVWTKGGLK